MKCVEAIECKDSIRSQECRRKPPLSYELCPSVQWVVAQAITVIYVHGMDARRIKNHESGRPMRWTRADASSVSELYVETKIFEGIFVKIFAGPLLQYEAISLTSSTIV